MSDNMRWRYGDTTPVMAAVDTGTVIEIGDLVWQDTNDAKPASDSTYDSGLATSQELFVDSFLGVAMQRSQTGETAPIRVATTGTFEYPCASAAFELGDFIGPDDNSVPDELENQKVIEVSDSARAFGYVAKREGSAVTTMLVQITSTIMAGGLQRGTSSA